MYRAALEITEKGELAIFLPQNLSTTTSSFGNAMKNIDFGITEEVLCDNRSVRDRVEKLKKLIHHACCDEGIYYLIY
jgi:hypothetical protein